MKYICPYSAPYRLANSQYVLTVVWIVEWIPSTRTKKAVPYKAQLFHFIKFVNLRIYKPTSMTP